MERLLYTVARGLIAFLQALPLRWVARLGRAAGRLALLLDARHRRVARANLRRCFPEKSEAEIRALLGEHFRRLGENYACAVKTAAMSPEQLRPHLEFRGPAWLDEPAGDTPPQSLVGAIGHFGNFELYAHAARRWPAYRMASTYRGLPQPSLNRLLMDLRSRSGCLFFERRSEGAALRRAMLQPGIILGLLCDQDGGDRGLQLPFFGHNCSTTPAPAVFALRYHCRLFPVICRRVALARWVIEVGQEIPTHHDGQPRSVRAIMLDVNRALEAAVRDDPANWFWVHNRWKRGRPDAPLPQPVAAHAV